MEKTINETNRRREIQLAYNEANGITPQQIKKAKTSALNKDRTTEPVPYIEPEYFSIASESVEEYSNIEDVRKAIAKARKLMGEAAKKLEFLEAAQYRDELIRLEDKLKSLK
jgi:excinuclease ABC subunit B